MGKQIVELLDQLRGLWRFHWHAVATAWIIAIMGFSIVYLMPDSYQAKAKVYVDTESVLRPLLQGIAVQRDVTTQMNMMSSMLLSRPTLERVIHETGLDVRAQNIRDQEKLIEDLKTKIDLESSGHSNTFTITYKDKDPELARNVVQTLLDVFMEDTVGIKRTDAGMASKFLQEQIKEYEKRLVEAEDRLAEFKKRNVGLMPGQSGDYYTRLQNLITSVENLRSRYNVLDGRRAEIRKQLSGEAPTFGGEKGMPSPIDEQLVQSRARLDQLLVQYTDKHPEVVALREQIARLEKDKAEGRNKPSGPVVMTTTTSDGRTVPMVNVNPVYQNLRLTLSQTDAEMAEVRTQMNDQERQIAELRSKVNTIPDVEAQLAQLNRDYEVNKTQHAARLQRLESARISGEADESADQTKFKVVEPPVKPKLPVGPKRPLMLAAVLAVALGGACGVAFLLDQLRPCFTSTEALKKAINLPVLGSVSDVRYGAPLRWWRKSAPMVMWSMGLLVCVFVASVIAVQRLSPAVRALLGLGVA
ncbi:MAG TPA: XrtA system polysaccharide chain length determinant [Steroidobacteraceae bacterium]|nr:XrtA system polysaccharide chain length determinant [Steroidobacteraceae bacterium]